MEDVFQAQEEGSKISLIMTSPRLDAAMVAKFKEQIAKHWRSGLTHAVVEMSSVEFIDSSGVGALLNVYRQLPQSAEAVTLKGMRPQVQSVVELLRLHRIFQIEP